ncbi:MAG: hypothetical protein IT555_19875, partial [Acetobacteraceae bacterium]|nr:hypothetical protein [Acetobacteraceae bacterium]
SSPGHQSDGGDGAADGKEGRSSFSEEKEAKRLFIRFLGDALSSLATLGNESFLVLFFKKEHSSLTSPHSGIL